MNNEELVNHVADENGITKAAARRVVDSVFCGITHGLSAYGKARLGDIGTLSIRHVEAREGRNPATGELMTIPAGNRLNFRTNAAFKRKIQ